MLAPDPEEEHIPNYDHGNPEGYINVQSRHGCLLNVSLNPVGRVLGCDPPAGVTAECDEEGVGHCLTSKRSTPGTSLP